MHRAPLLSIGIALNNSFSVPQVFAHFAKSTVFAIVTFSVAAVCVSHPGRAGAQEAAAPVVKAGAVPPSVIETIVDAVKPSLVRIHVVSSDAQAGREAKGESFGSGVIVSPEGYVVTNHHVAGNAKWLSCTLANREQVDARLIGTDALSDIAVIKLAPQSNGQPYPVANWGDSGRLRVGEAVLAMGSPLAFSQSVTAGIVSNTELVMPTGTAGFVLDGENVGSIVRWIGHDADIYPGNSGGPLVNLRGEIVGINEINIGLSGAIPGDLAREVSAQIIASGHVTRAYTGLDLQPRLRGDDRAAGVLVSGVVPASPAAKAGVRPGDLLIQADDARLDARFPEQLPLVNLQLSRLPLDRPAVLTVVRDGAQLQIPLSARARDAASAPSLEVRSLGLTGTDITPPVALEMKFPNADGVLIDSLLQGGPAAEAKPPLAEGDVIISARGQAVKSMAGLKAVLATVPRKPDGTATLIEVRRDGEVLLCVANINPENNEDASVEVAKAYLPASTQVVTAELVHMLGLPAGTQGVRLTQVFPGTAATAAGLRVGDIITRLDGQDVEASQLEDTDVFAGMLRQYKIGGWAKIGILRREPAAVKGVAGKAGARKPGVPRTGAKTVWKPRVIALKLPRAPKQDRELATFRDDNFGLALRSVTENDRLRGDADKGEQGALVTAVDDGSWAALAGLAEGDILRRIDTTPVTSMETARAKLRELEKQRVRRTVFFVSRGVHTLFVELQTDWSLPPAPAAKPAVAHPAEIKPAAE